MQADRRAAVAAGALYLVTHVTSVAAALLYQPVLDDPARAASSSARVLVAVLLEVVLAAAVVGTAVAMHPVLRRSREGLSTAYVATRTLEASAIITGALVMLALVGVGGSGGATTSPVAHALVGLHSAAFVVGQGVLVGIDTLVLAWLLWTTGLVPRWIPAIGLAGGALVLASDTGVLLGAFPQASVLPAVGGLVAFAWEISLALTLLLRGFRHPTAGAAVAEPVGVG